jgi:indolepyruvate ferredoxin oxidoreductase
MARISQMFEGDFQVAHHLAPPLLSPRNERGELKKRRFGPWVRTAMAVLARLKGLRGTALDPFGYTEERRTERALIAEYLDTLEQIVTTLQPANHAAAVELARVPELIKGFGHVKARHLVEARAIWQRRLAALQVPEDARAAA